MFYVSQLFGLLGMCIGFFIFQQKERKRLLRFKLSADILWGCHYILLNAWSGVIANAIGVCRECVFMNNEKKWAKSLLWPIFFLIAGWIATIFVWKSMFSLLPIFGSTLAVAAFWNKNVVVTKCISVAVSVCYLIYNLHVGSWIGIINEVIALTSIFISLVQTFRAFRGHLHDLFSFKA